MRWLGHGNCSPAGRLALIWLAAVGFAVSPRAAAATTVLRADVSARQIGLEDQVTLHITLEGTSIELQEELALPPLTNLSVVAGPSLSTQISFVNGRMSQARTYTYLLRPTAVGPATIGAVRAVLADGVRTTEPITIQVHEGRLLPRQRPSSPFALAEEEDPLAAFFGRETRPRPSQVLVEAEVSRKRLYVGEPLLLTYWVLTQSPIAHLDFAEAPRYPGFWSEPLREESKPTQGEAVQRDGEPFTRFPVYRRLLFPTQAGTATIPAATFTIAVPRRMGPFLDPFPGAATSLTRSTRPIEVVVEAPPAAEPFSGAVGQFRVTASVDRDAVALGEAVTYRFRVEGRGNLKWVDKAPVLDLPTAKVYPPQSKEEFSASPTGLSGSRTWEFVIVPQTAGTLRIPPVDFAYFDPAARQVSHGRTPLFEVEVRGAAPAQQLQPAAAAPAALAPGQPLHLRSELEPGRALFPTLGRGALAVLLGGVAAAHLALWGVPLLLSRRRTDRGGPPRRSVRSALATVRRATASPMTKEAAANLIEQALVAVFGEVDERPSLGDDERTTVLRELLRDVRFVRYAPQLGDYSEKIQDIARRARAAIERWG